ncbi:MAG: EAL domain-containing protein, partial [Burkholderiaceae bacterium]|nr:EAL domain-containing protein [Burkholderiaceae bacterium]
HGLLGGEFVIHYQPQLNNAGTITGVEALVRWQHPQRGLLYPGDFLAAAERAGLMDELDTQVLTDACSQLSQWSQKPAMRDLVISVNISAFQMGRNEFAAEVMAIIAKTGANTCRLKLELTETALVNDMSLATLSMASLQKQGVSFALDDFGTGYSSMSYLQRLPLDQLKIDQSFVKGLPHDNGSVAIVRAIVALSTNFGFEVLAEGVENQAQRDMLEAEGCHQYQGHLFHRAMPAADLELLIARSAATAFAL